MTTLYPLHDVYCNAEYPIGIAEGVSVIRNTINLRSLETDALSDRDVFNISQEQLCLEIDRDVIDPKEASIAFVISCRLLKRTKIFIRYRIDDLKNIVEVRDNYPYVTSDDATSWIDADEYQTISKLYEGLLRFKRINTRTSNAVYFLSLAYRSWKWIEATIFHVCAMETLTSADAYESGVTNKFKTRINNFIAYDMSKLEEIYNVRSELVHGRYSFETLDTNKRLRLIAEEVSRSVFFKLLTNSDLIEAFHDDDSRMNLF